MQVRWCMQLHQVLSEKGNAAKCQSVSMPSKMAWTWTYLQDWGTHCHVAEDSSVLGCDTVSPGQCFPAFWRTAVASSPKFKHFKNTALYLREWLRWSSIDLSPLKQGNWDRQLVLAIRKRRPCRHRESCPTGTFRLPLLTFFRALSSAVRPMPGYNSQRRGTAHTLPQVRRINFSALSLTLTMTILGLNPRKPYGQRFIPAWGLLPLTQWSSVFPWLGLQPRWEIINISAIRYSLRCLLPSPVMQSMQQCL
jgi:hypothetical protein